MTLYIFPCVGFDDFPGKLLQQSWVRGNDDAPDMCQIVRSQKTFTLRYVCIISLENEFIYNTNYPA